jgi:uridine kinase
MNNGASNPLPPVIIGIAGGTGSGKTTVALRVQEAAPGKTVQIIHHDSYYYDNSHLSPKDRAKINYDHPNAFETDLLVQHIEKLKRNEAVDVPTYDYASHSRLPDTRRVDPADIIFIEGILVLESEILRDLMDIRLYIGVDADERFIRRLKRDINKRGRSVESVIDQYMNVVRPMHQLFVNPSKKYAHLIIPKGGHNKVAIDVIASKITEIIRQRHSDL